MAKTKPSQPTDGNVTVDLRELLSQMIQTISDHTTIIQDLVGRVAAVEGFLERSQDDVAGLERDDEEEETDPIEYDDTGDLLD